MEKPHFRISRSKVLEQYRKAEDISDIVSYSSKTNSEVTKILESDTDCMFSVHFENELKHIKDLSRVWFLAQAWDAEKIQSLISRGVRSFVVDNESDLDIMIEYLQENDDLPTRIDLMLRVKLREMTLRTEKYYVFGMGCETVNKRIRLIRSESSLDGKIGSLGVHFHRKTQNMSEWRLKYDFTQMIDEDVIGMIDAVNIGGGLPSSYANTNDDVIPGIIGRIDDFRKWLKERDISMIIEPGRFIAASPARLVTHIIGIYDNNIVVDASVYNTDMDALIVPVKLKVEGELSQDDDSARSYVIKGCTPCSLDLFRYRVFLKGPKVGDEIVFLNAGAYNFTTDFCDLEKLETVIVD